jgi:hypothetical protein
MERLKQSIDAVGASCPWTNGGCPLRAVEKIV